MNNGQPKQGLEEPKFVPFKAKSLTLVALFLNQNLQQNIIFVASRAVQGVYSRLMMR
jgi:hypothetical protein